MLPAVQQTYYPFFEKISLAALTNSQPSIYFKAKKGTENNSADANKVSLLFNSKKTLQQEIDRSRATGQTGNYKYAGFVLAIDETFTAPLIFFLSLLLITPGKWPRKLLGFIVGTALVLGFTYLTVRFKGLHIVAESGLAGVAYTANELKATKLLHYAFSSVTSITVVLLIWILVAFRKSDLKNLFPNHKTQSPA